jgi:hypothetical protein
MAPSGLHLITIKIDVLATPLSQPIRAVEPARCQEGCDFSLMITLDQPVRPRRDLGLKRRGEQRIWRRAQSANLQRLHREVHHQRPGPVSAISPRSAIVALLPNAHDRVAIEAAAPRIYLGPSDACSGSDSSSSPNSRDRA